MNRGMFNIILMVAFIALIYFMMIRPQSKRDKETKKMRAELKAGDEVITIGGIVGKITKITDDRVVLQVGADRVKIEMVKSAIGNVVSASDKKTAEKKTAAKKEAPVEDEVQEKVHDRNKKPVPKKLNAKKTTKKDSDK